MIASNQLAEGPRWAQAQQAAGNASPALPLITDVLVTALKNQGLYEHALAQVAPLRQSAPDSLLLAIGESSVRYYTLTQGYRQADEVLTTFGRRFPHDTRIQQAIQFHRSMLAQWANLPGRAKRNVLPTMHVTTTRDRSPVFSDFDTSGIGGGGTGRAQQRSIPSGGCGGGMPAPPQATPVARFPKLPTLPTPPAPAKVKPAPPSENAQLGKQLASEAQLAALRADGGIKIAGLGTDTPVRIVARLVAEHGGRAVDWFKVVSHSYTSKDGTKFEIHAYWNSATKQLVEPKTIVKRMP